MILLLFFQECLLPFYHLRVYRNLGQGLPDVLTLTLTQAEVNQVDVMREVEPLDEGIGHHLGLLLGYRDQSQELPVQILGDLGQQDIADGPLDPGGNGGGVDHHLLIAFHIFICYLLNFWLNHSR